MYMQRIHALAGQSGYRDNRDLRHTVAYSVANPARFEKLRYKESLLLQGLLYKTDWLPVR